MYTEDVTKSLRYRISSSSTKGGLKIHVFADIQSTKKTEPFAGKEDKLLDKVAKR